MKSSSSQRSNPLTNLLRNYNPGREKSFPPRRGISEKRSGKVGPFARKWARDELWQPRGPDLRTQRDVSEWGPNSERETLQTYQIPFHVLQILNHFCSIFSTIFMHILISRASANMTRCQVPR